MFGSSQHHLALALIAELMSHRCYLYCLFSPVLWSLPQMRFTPSALKKKKTNKCSKKPLGLVLFCFGGRVPKSRENNTERFLSDKSARSISALPPTHQHPIKGAQGLLQPWISSSVLLIPLIPVPFPSGTDAVGSGLTWAVFSASCKQHPFLTSCARRKEPRGSALLPHSWHSSREAARMDFPFPAEQGFTWGYNLPVAGIIPCHGLSFRCHPTDTAPWWALLPLGLPLACCSTYGKASSSCQLLIHTGIVLGKQLLLEN